jgi:hypothetical protein
MTDGRVVIARSLSGRQLNRLRRSRHVLPQCSNSVAMGAIADVADARSKRRVRQILTCYKRVNGALDAVSKIRRPEFIRSFSPLLVRLYCRREDRCTISIKCEKQARFITLRFRLQPLERLFGYKE